MTTEEFLDEIDCASQVEGGTSIHVLMKALQLCAQALWEDDRSEIIQQLKGETNGVHNRSRGESPVAGD